MHQYPSFRIRTKQMEFVLNCRALVDRGKTKRTKLPKFVWKNSFEFVFSQQKGKKNEKCIWAMKVFRNIIIGHSMDRLFRSTFGTIWWLLSRIPTWHRIKHFSTISSAFDYSFYACVMTRANARMKTARMK